MTRLTHLRPRFPSGNPERLRAYCNAAIDEVVDHSLAIDFDAADLRFAHANGDTVSSWVARRGGLTATATGTPTYTAPDQTLRVPSVAYAASGEAHGTSTTIDWSASNKATILTVWISDANTANGGVASIAASLTSTCSTSGGIEHLLGASSGYWTALHRPDGADDFWLERDQIDDTGVARVTVSVHDTAAALQADEIRGYQDGIEITGSTTGTNGSSANWQSALHAVMGARDAQGDEGLDGRLARFIASPQKISVAGVAAVTEALNAIRGSWFVP